MEFVNLVKAIELITERRGIARSIDMDRLGHLGLLGFIQHGL